jgi:hypothetical protein
MSVLSDIFSSGGGAPPDLDALSKDALARQQAYADSLKPTTVAVVPPPPDPPPPAYAGPGALQQLNDALGSGFESRYEPDTVASPFEASALTSGRSKADDFISNMLKRGTLTESGRAGATSALDLQTPGIQTKLQNIGSGILSSDRSNLTNVANNLRGSVGGTSGEGFDPTPLVNQIASTGAAQSGTFGDRFNASLPPGDLFDTSGIASAGGGVSAPENIQFDPYSQEGGKLNTGLDDSSSVLPSGGRRRTSVF